MSKLIMDKYYGKSSHSKIFKNNSPLRGVLRPSVAMGFLHRGHAPPRAFPVSLFQALSSNLLFQRSLAATDRYLVN